MIKNWNELTINAKISCAADFFWNFGRTLPHAILTIFLISAGCSLSEIAILQTVYMIVAMTTEFPSGIASDRTSRKFIYLCGVVMIFISYTIILLMNSNFIALVIAYALYGLSVSLKSGTLDAEIILEFSKQNRDIKHYSVVSSYLSSMSSILGGLIGSFLYGLINEKLYILSLVFFIIAFVFASLPKFAREDCENKEGTKNTLMRDIKEGAELLRNSYPLKRVIMLMLITMIFIQPFYQYWQVLYEEQGIPTEYFGIIYVGFQLCNVIGTYIYEKISKAGIDFRIIVALLPIFYSLFLIDKKLATILLPITVVLFYAYDLHLEVLLKKNVSGNQISSIISLIGTLTNVASIICLNMMAGIMMFTGISMAYFISILMFAVPTIFMIGKKETNDDISDSISA